MVTILEITQLKNRIQNSINKSAHLYTINKPKPYNPNVPFSIKSTRNSTPVANALINLFVLYLEKAIKNEAVAYDINLETNHYIQYLDSALVPNSNIINDQITSPQVARLQRLDADFYKTIWAYAVKLQFDGDELIFYRKYSEGKILSSTKFDSLILRNGVFSMMNENVFRIDSKVDAFLYNNEIVMFNTTNFERIFGYEEIYEAEAVLALQELGATHNFVNITDLTNFVNTDSRKIRKLAAIRHNNLIPRMGFAQIQSTINNYNLQITIDTTNQSFAITKNNSFKFLKALNDDYLRSEATANRYEATSKRQS